MNYIKLLNIFNEIARSQDFSVQAQMIYYKLLDAWNRAGRPRYIRVNNMRLMVEAMLKTERMLIRSRKELINAGIIRYDKGHKGVPNRYEIIDLEQTRASFNLDYYVEDDNINTHAKYTVQKDSQYDSQNGSINDSKKDSENDSINYFPKSTEESTYKSTENPIPSKLDKSKTNNTLTCKKDSQYDSINDSEKCSKNDSKKNHQQKSCFTCKIDSQNDSQNDSHNRVRVRGIYKSIISNTLNADELEKTGVENGNKTELKPDEKIVLDFLHENYLVDLSTVGNKKAIDMANTYGAKYTNLAIQKALDKNTTLEAKMNDIRLLAYADAILQSWAKDGYPAPIQHVEIREKAVFDNHCSNNIAMESLRRIIESED